MPTVPASTPDARRSWDGSMTLPDDATAQTSLFNRGHAQELLALTAQRYRIRRRISQLRFLDTALLHPVCEVGRRGLVALRDELLGGPVGEQRLDFRTVLVQFAFAGAFRPSDRQTGSPSRAKGFFRPRGDQPRSISAAIFPPKSRSNHPRKMGGAKSMIYTPFQ